MHRASLSDTFSAGVSQPPCPLVSVIIAYYKQEGFIAETVRSVQQQTYPNIEIIVVDDGSPVPASAVLPKISGLRIVRTENRGCPAARNFAFSRVPGTFLPFLISDDRPTLGAIEARLNAFAQRLLANIFLLHR